MQRNKKHGGLARKINAVILLPALFPLILGVLGILSQSSCATRPPASSYEPVSITTKARFILLGPEYLEAPLDMAQHIRGSYGDREFLADAWVKADNNGIVMALFNSMGASLGEFSFDDEGVSFSSALFPAIVKPEYIAADFQFCFYQAEALEAALKRAGLGFRAEAVEGGGIRRITEGSTPIITIEKKAASISYTNHLRGYAYTLEGNF
jgi:hypothetical protein